jgi:putative heme-binding domain-containing protein
MFAELMKKDPDLAAAMLASPDFGRPDHALFARTPGFDQPAAAERFLTASKKPDFVWNADLIAVVGSLPAEKSLPPLRALWGKAGLDEVILPYLARAAQAEDKARLRTGLGLAQPATVSLCLEALDHIDAKADREEVLDLLLALGRVPPEKEHQPLRDRILARLRSATEQKFETADDWKAWYIRTYPDKAARLADPDGVDVAAWDKRLAKIDWTTGDVERGRQIFVKASCAACHGGSRALGPDLAGVGKRFSRADILTAIIRPSKDVSPRYRTTMLTTAQGKTYQGLIAYEAVDSVILQTGPGMTVRIVNDQITERRQTTLSLMPAGLLDRLTDAEIADLIAFLK